MISWDTCCLFESMRIGRTESFFEKIPDMICLDEVYNEVKDGKEKFLSDSKDMLSILVDEYNLDVTLDSIQKQRNLFLNKITPVSTKDLEDIKKELREDLIPLRVKIGNGDLGILAYCRKESSTVITHDETLFSLLAGETKTLFLIEFIIENIDCLDNININEINYLYYYCLARYNLSLKELKGKLGEIGGNMIHVKKIRILKFIKERDPLQNRAIISKRF